jgi:hypothetical protein
MAPPVVTSESCVFNKIGEGFWCPERFTLLDDMPCFGILRLVTTYYTYPEPTPGSANFHGTVHPFPDRPRRRRGG